MAEPPKKKKVVILGGGMSAVTTAMQLSEPGWRDRFESITLYQMGWRLGGKGATGRGAHDGIEEHGLHIWLGYYENAFKLIQQIYQSAARPKGSPLATWREAFTQHDYVGVNQLHKGEWQPWMFDFPRNLGTPGKGGKLPSVREYLEMILGWIGRLHHPHDLVGWVKWVSREAGLVLGVLGDESLHALSKQLRLHADKVHADHHHDFLKDLLRKVTKHLEYELREEAEHDLEMRRLLLLMNMGATIVLGMLVDGVLSSKDLEKLETKDFSAWLKSHNAFERVWNVQTNPLLRGMYDFAFAYENGDPARPNFAAAPALRTVFRMCLTYKGSIFWKMNAGMGDSIFAPAYQALVNRGVCVEFFHKVTNLGLSADKQRVATIEIDVQATPKDGSYDPLIDIPTGGGVLPCWPKHPRYEQLAEGQQLQDQCINLESFWTTWTGRPKTLKVDEHFDVIVFGISIGSVPYLCRELADAKEQWLQMVKHVATVRTQALQLWLKPTIRELGWKKESPLIDAWIAPLNTWADMTQLLDYESWGVGNKPGSLAYFCGPMTGGIPNQTESDFPARAYAQVVATADRMLAGPIATLWKALDSNGLPASARILSFHRANIDPSERYVMSLADSAQFRLAANESGLTNLVLTGDWISNGYNAGCIEASAWAGIQAANVVLGRPLNDGVIS